MSNQKDKILDNFITRLNNTQKVSKGDIIRLESDIGASVITGDTSIDFFTTVPSSLGWDLVLKKVNYYRELNRKHGMDMRKYLEWMRSHVGALKDLHKYRNYASRNKHYIGYSDVVNIGGEEPFKGKIIALCDMGLGEFVENYEIFVQVLARDNEHVKDSLYKVNFETFMDFFLVAYEHYMSLEAGIGKNSKVDEIVSKAKELFDVLMPDNRQNFYHGGKLVESNLTTEECPKYVLNIDAATEIMLKDQITVEMVFKIIDVYAVMMEDFTRSISNANTIAIGGGSWWYTDMDAYERTVSGGNDFVRAFLTVMSYFDADSNSDRDDDDDDDDD